MALFWNLSALSNILLFLTSSRLSLSSGHSVLWMGVFANKIKTKSKQNQKTKKQKG